MKKKNEEISVVEIDRGRIEFCVKGDSPLIYNAMSAKARRDLLYPRKKTAAEKQASAKHNPIEEYRSSVYHWNADETLLCLPAVMFKQAMASAALDLEGCNKSQIQRLTWAVGDKIALYGVPELKMDVVRSADMKQTPDIRTRAIVREWACSVRFEYMQPILNRTTVVRLFQAAGMMRGVGDFRQEKGAGNYGQFRAVDPEDEDWNRILREGGRGAQQAAFDTPVCYDKETEELLEWWQQEYKARGHDQS